jgi:magnesium-transporting ATPase (P-type)
VAWLTYVHCRILDSINFETDEALLTGESLPVAKDERTVFEEDTGPGDRLNVAFSSSSVTKGRATGVVYAVGMRTVCQSDPGL